MKSVLSGPSTNEKHSVTIYTIQGVPRRLPIAISPEVTENNEIVHGPDYMSGVNINNHTVFGYFKHGCRRYLYSTRDCPLSAGVWASAILRG